MVYSIDEKSGVQECKVYTYQKGKKTLSPNNVNPPSHLSSHEGRVKPNHFYWQLHKQTTAQGRGVISKNSKLFDKPLLNPVQMCSPKIQVQLTPTITNPSPIENIIYI